MKYLSTSTKVVKIAGVTLTTLFFFVACGTNQATAPFTQAPPDSTSVIEESFVAPVLGVVIDAQGRVLYIEPRSGAQQAGVKVGDTLTELDGMQFAPALKAATAEQTLVYGQAIQAIRVKIGSGKVMKLTLQRGSQLITLDAQAKPYPAREHQPTPTAVPPNRLYM